MALSYHRIAEQFFNRPLLLAPANAETIAAFLRSREAVSSMECDAATTVEAFPAEQGDGGSLIYHSPRASRFVGQTPADANGRRLPYRRTQDGVAIITVVGELVNRGAWIGAHSGLVSYEAIKHQLSQAVADPKTKAIILDLETPGGEAVGAFEAAAAVREAAKVKPVVAVVNGMAASAGYALASGASRIVTMSTGASGSIGVVMVHLDFSRLLANEGIKPTLIFAGGRKVDGNRFEPIPDAVRADFQREIDAFYTQFIATVRAGRPSLSEAAIRATEARTYLGEDAVRVGLADSVGTLETVLAELSRGAPPALHIGASKEKTTMQTTTHAATIAKPAASKEATKAQLESEWADSPQLRAEFPSAQVYSAYVQAERAGKVRRVAATCTRAQASEFRRA